ncbi:MAG: dockerin type I domain-containing protein [Oscillospiraceae bacterium]|nr:dockerin type I domain-containing protein [Oscillospiraceae bacterium]
MKKIISALLIAAMVLSLALPASASEISTMDALAILRHVAGTVPLIPQQRARLDLNNDGEITTADALVALRIVAGLQEAPEITPSATAGNITVTLNKPIYERGEAIQVTVSGMTQREVNLGAALAMYNEGALHRDNLLTRTPPSGTQTIEIAAPTHNGVFEMRLYSSVPYSDESILLTITFSVGGAR